MSVHEIGQSTPQFLPFAQHRSQAVAKGIAQEKSQPAAVEQEGQRAVLTTDEKQFFEQLFPGSAAEIRSHQAYTNNGQHVHPQQTGTLIDRKG
jgi:hypothetical protein